MSALRLPACCLALALSFGSPMVASAAWPIEGGGGVILAYGTTYLRGDVESVHSGVDIGCSQGAAVLAPVDGVVTFAGPIPGDGGQVLAITVRTAEGLLVTCMPLEETAMVAGQVVGTGELLGAVALSGDPSSQAPHLHASVRRGDTYLDPAATIGPAPDAGEAPGDEPAAWPEPGATSSACEEGQSLGGVQGGLSSEARESEQVAREVAMPTGEVVLQERALVPGQPVTSRVVDRVSDMGTRVPAVEHEGRDGAFTAVSQVEAADSPRSFRDPFSVAPHGRARSANHAIKTGPAVAGGAMPPLLAGGLFVVAGVGLWPLWRRRTRPALLPGVRPTLDDVAAAVGR